MKPLLAVLAAVALLAGCATHGGRPAAPLTAHLGEPGPTQACARYFQTLEDAVTRAGVADGGTARIPGFPYLRTDRFLASFAPELDPDTREAWADRLQALALDGLRIEWANLPATHRAAVAEAAPVGLTPEAAVGACAELLRGHDLAGEAGWVLLRARATVPPDYERYKRVLGVYPLTSLAVLAGVRSWHGRTHAAYAQPLEVLPVDGRLVRYVPPRALAPLRVAEVGEVLRRSADNALAIPEPEGADRARLFATFAPIFEVDVVSNDDRIGRPAWSHWGEPWVATADPVVYVHTSHTRFDGAVLLQLNYTVWFPARTATGALDILAGPLDGLHWRVTLDRDGQPLLYDTIHNCGCYHTFFPTERLRLRSRLEGYNEPPLLPQTAPAMAPGQRPVVRVSSVAHYVERLYMEAADRGVPYRVAPYAALRSLPVGSGQRRSLFRPDGIVSGTERPERWLFWPMGVPEPGAMRQWGRHATAFVGHRHFDDADLYQRLFVRRDGGSAP